MLSCNKYVRRFREHLACKLHFQDNVRDIQVRLLFCSDPVLLTNRFRTQTSKSDEGETVNKQNSLYNDIVVRNIKTLIHCQILRCHWGILSFLESIGSISYM